MKSAVFVLEMLGVASAAISGAMVGIDKKCDAFGVVFLSVITALGGGVIRDIMLGYLPPRMFTSFSYLSVALICSLSVFIVAWAKREQYRAHKVKLDAINNLFDAMGLASFTVVGMDLTIASYGMGNPLLVLALGMTTGVGGGMLRDLLTNTMPRVLYKRIYAVASLAGGLLYYILLYFGMEKVSASLICMGLIILLRLLATKFKWNLPHAEI